jgi:hypothetical protein
MKEGNKRDYDIILDFKYFVLISSNYYLNNYSVPVTYFIMLQLIFCSMYSLIYVSFT